MGVHWFIRGWNSWTVVPGKARRPNGADGRFTVRAGSNSAHVTRREINLRSFFSSALRDKIKTVTHFAINLLTRNRSMIRYNHRT